MTLHCRKAQRNILLCLFVGILWFNPSLTYTQTAPAGFAIEDVFPSTSFTIPVQIVFFPDGRKFVVEKAGFVWMITSGNVKLPTPFIDLSAKVLSNFDKGLLGVALDPDFATNRWVYFLYVVDPDSNGDDSNTSAFSRVERYQADSLNPNVANLASRQILIGGSWSTGIPYVAIDGSHSIGTLRFGRDKTLLVGSGDAAHFDNTDRGGLDPGAFGTGKTSSTQDIGAFRAQSVNSLNGKILRVDKETGLGLPSNPFWDGNANSARSRVWVYGLRNPFRFVLRPGSGSTLPSDSLPGTLYIGDVGWNTIEKLNIAKKGRINFGWPCIEGASNVPEYQAVTSTASPNANVLCGAPLNSENPSPKTLPSLWWHHSNGNSSNPVGWVGSCSIGGAFYTGTSYPARYRNSVFIADYAANWIRSVQVDANDNIVNGGDTLFVTNAQGPVSMEPDPITGDLYYVGINTAKIYRIRYTTGNRNPVVNASISPTSGFSPLVVTATASASSDPDGDPLSYIWTFGDGGTAHRADTSYTYTVNGTYTVSLTVSDNRGGSAPASFQVVVGQLAPVANIINPIDHSFFTQNQMVVLQAAAADTTAGPVTYQWDIDLEHNTHVHPSQFILPGQNNSFVASTPDDGERYYWRVRLGVTRGTLTSTDTANILPRLNLTPVALSFSPQSPPSGSQFQVLTKIRSVGDVGTSPGILQVMEGTTVLGTGNIGSIAKGDSTIVIANVGPLSAGQHTIHVVIDALNDVYETNELDNDISTTLTVGPPGQDITSQGTAIALITAPQGSGNHSLSVISDGVYPAVGSANTQQQYDTWNGGAVRALDWIGYQFPASHTYVGLTFQEGMHFSDGGWFNTMQVEIRVGGVWTAAQNLVASPAYPGNNAVNYETFNLSFVPMVGDGIRISGVPGGAGYFISVGELRVLVNDGPPVVSTVAVVTPNGGENWSAGTVQNITWNSTNTTSVNLSYKTSPAGAWTSIAQNLSAASGTYAWTVPNTPTIQARVRVLNAQNTAVVDSSDANFTIAGIPAITVLTPNGGEVWQINSGKTITWSAVSVANVNLFYKTSPAGAWTSIAQNVAASTGSFVWTVPNTSTTQARIKIVNALNATPVDSSDADFTITNAPTDITSQGTAIALITAPTGSGNHSLTVISDGVFPAVGSSNSQQQYDTWNGGAVRTLDWIGYQFAVTHTFVGLTFQEGMQFFDGGWFTTLAVQVRVGGVWTAVQNLVSTPAYSGNNGVNYETFNLTFASMTGDAVRISGPPGGSAYFISVGELRALVNDGPPPVSTVIVVAPNGGESWLAGTVQNITWNSANTTTVNLSYKTSPTGNWTSIASNLSAGTGLYAWTVPNTPGTQTRVRIVNAQNAVVLDSSDADFTILAIPAVTVQSPNGGEILPVSTNATITWSYANVANLNLFYKTSAAGVWTSIAQNVPAASGSFVWNVPSTPTTQARIKIVNASGATPVDSSDADFTIGTPLITVAAPNGGENWTANTNQDISWSSTNVATVNLSYKISLGGTWTSIAQNVSAAAGRFTWTIPNTPTTQAKVRIISAQNATVLDSSDTVFTILGIPAITVLVPNGGEVWPINSSKTITWSLVNVANVDLFYKTSPAGVWTSIAQNIPAASGSYAWTVPNTPTTQARVKIVNTLGATPVDSSDADFTIGTPAVTLLTPNGGESWSAATVQNITWSSTNVTTVNLSYKTSPTGAWTSIAQNLSAAGGTYAWTVPNVSSAQARVRVVSVQSSAVVDSSDADFTITGIPSITVLVPNGGESWAINSSKTITWSSVTVTTVNLFYKTLPAGPWIVIAQNISAASGSYIWTVPNAVTTQARIKIVNAQGATPVDSSDANFTITNGVQPQDITSLGTAIAFITAPAGSGNHSLSVIKDGIFPPVGSGDTQQQYDTWNGGGARATDWIGYQFAASHTFSSLTFQEGMHFWDGGWFTTLQVQARVSGVWTNVSGLISTPAYAGNNGVNYETFNLTFTPMAGDGIRISGTPGGSGHFISVGELRSIANEPVALRSFTVTVTDGIAQLGWQKLQNTRMAGFEILKAADRYGDFRAITNDPIFSQPPEGRYGYVDQSSEVGTWYYKVKQIDVDGAMHYSDCVEADILTTVSEDEPLPNEFSLEQNYPNPFNPVTAIGFALPKESRVKLEVYNVLGERVKVLVDEIRQSGHYVEQFDASGIASGIYFYRIQAHSTEAGKAGDFVAIRKLVLLK